MLSGCTTAADHHYLYPEGLENAVDIEVEEARRLGMRMTVSRGSMNLSEKDGGLPPDSVVQDEETILADSERVLKLFHDPKPGARIRVALAPCSPFSISKDLMIESAKLAERYDCQLHTHLCETEDEEQFCLKMYGLDPSTSSRRQAGCRAASGSRTAFISILRRSLGSGERKSASAIARRRIWSWPLASVRPASSRPPVRRSVLASMVRPPTISSNMMEALRHALMIGHLRYGAERVTHRDVLRWATEGSARCLGRSDIGKIAEGYEADLALFTLDEPRFSGAHDPLAALVLCGAHRADRVMIAGEWRVIDGQPVGLDLAALIAEHKRAARDFA